MKKERFYLQGKDFAQERFSHRGQVSFEWNMLYACNYRCPHCIFHGKWEEYGKKTAYLSVEEWMGHWGRIHERYGRVSLVITGGEPFIYPDFIQLTESLSAIHYPINISTNSSGNLQEFAERIDPERVSLTLSFQPYSDGIEEVLERAKFLRKGNFRFDYINLCAYPPYLKDLDKYLKKVVAAGERLKVIPFYGEYNNVIYPRGYSEEEKKMLGLDREWEKNVKRRGSLCAAGQRSALLLPDGKVVRCGQVGERLIIGNFFSREFKLLDRPLPCDAEFCPCLEVVPVEEAK